MNKAELLEEKLKLLNQLDLEKDNIKEVFKETESEEQQKEKNDDSQAPTSDKKK